MTLEQINKIQDCMGVLTKKEIEHLSIIYHTDEIIQKVIDGLIMERGHFGAYKP